MTTAHISFELQQQPGRQRSNMSVHHHHHELAMMNRIVGMKNMPPSPRAVPPEHLRATPTITNRSSSSSSARNVDDEKLPPASSSSSPRNNHTTTTNLTKKRVFLMHALGRIEMEINRMRHAQKTAHDLEAALRTRRIALMEQEMEMHERRCDYLEVMRTFSGDFIASGNVSPFSPNKDKDNDSSTTKKSGGKRAQLCNDEDDEEELVRPSNKKLKLESPSLLSGRMHPGRFLPGSQANLWMSRESTSAAAAAAATTIPTLEQSSLTLLSEMAMRLMGSTTTTTAPGGGAGGGQRSGPANNSVSPPIRRLHPMMVQQMNAMAGYPPTRYPRLESSP